MLLIKNARILMPDGLFLPQGDILTDGGKIVCVDNSIQESNAKVIDAKGLTAMPGLVDAHCHIGMWDDSLRWEGDDGNESIDPVTPALRAIDSLYIQDVTFEEALRGGVTTVATGPGSANCIGGQFAAIKTGGGKYIEDRLIREPLALKMAFGENPKGCYGQKGKTPKTRMAVAAVIREAFVKAQNYMRKCEDPDPAKHPDRDLAMEMLCKALRREVIVKCHAHRADDILTAIRICREFNLNFSIEHCTEGWLIADRLAAEKVPVILGPLLTDRSKPELRNKTFRAPGLMEKAGIPFALMTDSPVIPEEYLAVEAAICVKEGLSEAGALKAITIHAANVIGLGDRVGSLEKGKDADICLYDGHPLDARSHVVTCILNGKTAFEA